MSTLAIVIFVAGSQRVLSEVNPNKVVGPRPCAIAGLTCSFI
jgi:hypothetical protein